MSQSQRFPSRNYIETALALLLLLALIFSLYKVLNIFFGVFTYAIILAVSFAHPFEKLTKAVGNKRKIAASIYSVVLLAVLALPFFFIVSNLAQRIRGVENWIVEAKTQSVPPLADWIINLPWIGENAGTFWSDVQKDPSGMISSHEVQIRGLLKTILSGGAGILGASLEFALGIIVSAVFLINKDRVLKPLYTGMRKLAGEEDGPAMVHASGRAVKGVAIGVMGTGLIAGVLSFICYKIVGIHFSLLLAAITFFLVVIQLGPWLVWLPVCIWFAHEGHTGSAIFIAAYGVVVLMGVDTFLKPILIAKSGKLPVLVLFIGVIGGMAAWGFTGMFKGAIILSVFYTIIRSWLGKPRDGEPEMV